MTWIGSRSLSPCLSTCHHRLRHYRGAIWIQHATDSSSGRDGTDGRHYSVPDTQTEHLASGIRTRIGLNDTRSCGGRRPIRGRSAGRSATPISYAYVIGCVSAACARFSMPSRRRSLSRQSIGRWRGALAALFGFPTPTDRTPSANDLERVEDILPRASVGRSDGRRGNIIFGC